jgi:hypothetical protein
MREGTLAGLVVVCLTVGCHGLWSSARIEDDEQEPPTVCEVHDLPLQEDVVPVSYGFPNMEFRQAQYFEFPHAEVTHHGGCMVTDTRQAKVNYCPECRKAYEAWVAKQSEK